MTQTQKAAAMSAIEKGDLLRGMAFAQMAALVETFALDEHSLSLTQVMEVVAMFADVVEQVYPDIDAKEGLADLLRGCASDLILDSAADFVLIALADLK